MNKDVNKYWNKVQFGMFYPEFSTFRGLSISLKIYKWSLKLKWQSEVIFKKDNSNSMIWNLKMIYNFYSHLFIQPFFCGLEYFLETGSFCTQRLLLVQIFPWQHLKEKFTFSLSTVESEQVGSNPITLNSGLTQTRSSFFAFVVK